MSRVVQRKKLFYASLDETTSRQLRAPHKKIAGYEKVMCAIVRSVSSGYSKCVMHLLCCIAETFGGNKVQT